MVRRDEVWEKLETNVRWRRSRARYTGSGTRSTLFITKARLSPPPDESGIITELVKGRSASPVSPNALLLVEAVSPPETEAPCVHLADSRTEGLGSAIILSASTTTPPTSRSPLPSTQALAC